MKTYIVEAYALNEIWYKETWKVKANTQKEAQRLVESQSSEAELQDEEQQEVENTRADFEIESVKVKEDA
tara:strand:- start:51 stop:260 length:210 start_codon:yes stop_codon:yes gene_type:complete